MKPSNYQPLHKRLFAFSVPIQHKVAGSKLYRGAPRRGQFSEARPIWVVASAKDCVDTWSVGQKCYVSDGFALEPVDLGLWDEFKDLPEFADLRAFVEDVEGEVDTIVVNEGSILGVEDE
jgi:hypothetical protein